jgi:hypothetical protein
VLVGVAAVVVGTVVAGGDGVVLVSVAAVVVAAVVVGTVVAGGDGVVLVSVAAVVVAAVVVGSAVVAAGTVVSGRGVVDDALSSPPSQAATATRPSSGQRRAGTHRRHGRPLLDATTRRENTLSC